LVPVRPCKSRRAHSNGISAAASITAASPFIINSYFAIPLTPPIKPFYERLFYENLFAETILFKILCLATDKTAGCCDITAIQSVDADLSFRYPVSNPSTDMGPRKYLITPPIACLTMKHRGVFKWLAAPSNAQQKA
jgi:hypothetical protein